MRGGLMRGLAQVPPSPLYWCFSMVLRSEGLFTGLSRAFVVFFERFMGIVGLICCEQTLSRAFALDLGDEWGDSGYSTGPEVHPLALPGCARLQYPETGPRPTGLSFPVGLKERRRSALAAGSHDLRRDFERSRV